MAGRLELDEVRREVRLDGAKVDLSRGEFDLLATLMRRPGSAVSSASLLSVLRGPAWAKDNEVLQVQISRLRRKLGESAAHPRFILTIYGFGYRFEPDSDDQGPPGASVSLLMSLDRTIRWVSDNVVELLGWAPDDLVGTSGLDLVDPDTRLGDGEQQLIDPGKPQVGLGRLRTRTGGWRHVAAAGRPVVDIHGTVTGLLVTWWADLGVHPDVSLEPIRLHPVSSNESARTLVMDDALILRGIEPRAPFLGWEPQEILGTFFSPTGLTQSALKVVIADAINIGNLETAGPVQLHDRDGRVVGAVLTARIEVDARGQFSGLRATLTLGPGP